MFAHQKKTSQMLFQVEVEAKEANGKRNGEVQKNYNTAEL